MRFIQRYHLERHSLIHTGMRLLTVPILQKPGYICSLSLESMDRCSGFILSVDSNFQQSHPPNTKKIDRSWCNTMWSNGPESTIKNFCFDIFDDDFFSLLGCSLFALIVILALLDSDQMFETHIFPDYYMGLSSVACGLRNKPLLWRFLILMVWSTSLNWFDFI